MNFGGTIYLNKAYCLVLASCLVLCIYIFANSSNSKNNTSSSHINLHALLTTAIQAAKNGGREVVSNKDHYIVESKGKTMEGANDSVTTADYKSNCAMIKTLKRDFPKLLLISEESKVDCSQSKDPPIDSLIASELRYLEDEWINVEDIKVWIDPLDATQEYTEHLYEYVTTMVCVAVRGKPVIGVIYKPFSKELTWAWVNKDHSNNLKLIQETNKKSIKFIVSRSHTGKAKDILKELFKGESSEIIVAAGAGYKAIEVATGKADAYIHVTAIKKWDICAGNAVINAVGGHMTTKYNTQINYDDVSNVLNNDGLVATLRNHKIFVDKMY